MGHLAFYTVPERFTQADGKPFHGAFHYAAQGIALDLSCLQGLWPLVGVGEAAYGYQLCMELGKIKHFFGNDAGCHNAKGDPAAEMAAAAGVVEPAVLEVGRKVGVAGTGVLAELLVVLAAGVLVLEQDGERGSGGLSLEHAGDNLGLIGLQARGGPQRTGLAAGKILHEIGLAERNAGQHAVYGNPDAGAVGFTEDTDSEFITKSIHVLCSMR